MTAPPPLTDADLAVIRAAFTASLELAHLCEPDGPLRHWPLHRRRLYKVAAQMHAATSAVVEAPGVRP